MDLWIVYSYKIPVQDDALITPKGQINALGLQYIGANSSNSPGAPDNGADIPFRAYISRSILILALVSAGILVFV